MKNILLSVGFFAVVSLAGEITGTVKTSTGTGDPIQNVKVRSALTGDTALTDEFGTFTIGSNTSSVAALKTLANGTGLAFTGKNISLTLPQAVVVNLSISQVNGRSKILYKGNLSAGVHTFALSTFAPGVVIISGSIAGIIVTRKFVVGESGTIAFGDAVASGGSNKSRALGWDTLWFEKSGYWLKPVEVEVNQYTSVLKYVGLDSTYVNCFVDNYKQSVIEFVGGSKNVYPSDTAISFTVAPKPNFVFDSVYSSTYPVTVSVDTITMKFSAMKTKPKELSVVLNYHYTGPYVAVGQKNIPSGTFAMGDSTSGSSALPIHMVTISSFYMDSTEVTRQEYRRLTGADPANFTKSLNAPVEALTWFDAVLYCNARSKAEGKDTVYSYTKITANTNCCYKLDSLAIDYSKKGYRLPTEAEWEYACRAGSTTPYYWGADTTGQNDNSWNPTNSGGSPQVVATKLPNAFGLYDMSGNVREFCNDNYSVYSSDTVINPTGSTVSSSMVVRGGSISDDKLSSAFRNSSSPSVYNAYIGFRCVLPQ